MNNQFLTLHCDDDVILLEKDTYKVSRIKELMSQDIRNRLRRSLYKSTPTQEHDTLIMGFLSQVALGENIVDLDTIEFHAVKDCQLLQVGGKIWQKGKLKIHVIISTDTKVPDVVSLEFCSTEAAQLATV